MYRTCIIMFCLLLTACMSAQTDEDFTSAAEPSMQERATDTLVREPAEPDLVELADGRELPRDHPDVLEAIRQRQQERVEARENEQEQRQRDQQERELERQRAEVEREQQAQREQQLAMLAAPSGVERLAGQVSCETTNTGWCEMAEEFLSGYEFDWRELGWSAVASDALPDEWLGGVARAHEKTIYVFPRDDWHTYTLQRVLAHELAHAVDHELLSPQDRERYRVARDIPATNPYWAGQWPHDHSATGEDFAELFSIWSVGGQSKSPWLFPPDLRQFAEWLWPPGCDVCTFDVGEGNTAG